MGNCSCCGMAAPEGQVVCSMCYGDMSYGTDNYYRQWAEGQEAQAEAQREAEELEYNDKLLEDARDIKEEMKITSKGE